MNMQTVNKSKQVHVVVVGQTPPPYHGQAIAIAELVNADWSDISIHHIRLAYSGSAAEIGKFSFRKVWHLFSRAFQTIHLLRKHPGAILYYPPGGSTLPIIRDVVFLCLVRPFAGKLVLHFHASGIKKTLQPKWWLRKVALLAYGKADIAIKLQPSIPDDAEYLAPKKIVIVPNGLDVPDTNRMQKKDKEIIKILFAGTHTEEKGIFIIVDVIKRLCEMGHKVEMRMMGSWGSAAEEEKCRRLVKENRLERNIIFLGSLTGNAKWQEYANADIFFFPTFYRAELMPLVIIEAMAFSLPVVASRWRGIVDMVKDGKTGLLFPVKNIDAATKQLEILISDATLRKSMGEYARSCYEKNYTLDKHLDAMHQVFIKVDGE